MVYLWIVPLIAIVWGIQATLKYIIGPYLVVTNNWYKIVPLRYRFSLIVYDIQWNSNDRQIIQNKLNNIKNYQKSILRSPFITKQIKDSFNKSLNISLFAITRRWLFAYKAKVDTLTLHEFNNLTHEKMFINELNKVSNSMSELLIQTNYPETIQAKELTRVENNLTLSMSTQMILNPVLTRLKNAKKLTKPNSENALILSRLIEQDLPKMAHEFEKATENNANTREAQDLFINICEKAKNIAVTTENDLTNDIAENPINNLQIFSRYLDTRQIEKIA